MKFNSRNLKSCFLILSWALYDLANQFFALNVVSLYFVRWLTFEKKTPEIFYSISFGISIFLVGILAPVLGTASDLTGRRRVYLVYLTLLSVVFTMLLGVSENVFLNLLFFAIANFGCQLAVVFYNAMMVNITPQGKIGLVSGFGRMLGYSGAILALYFVKPVVLKEGYRAAFLPTGLLFLVFSLPCMIFVKDRDIKGAVNLGWLFKKERLIDFLKTLRVNAIGLYRTAGLSDFLKAVFFGFSAVNIIILYMAVYASRVFGLKETEIINLIAFSTLFAIIGSLISGFISDYIGCKSSLILVFILWAVCFLMGSIVSSSSLYWVIGALVGTSLGAIWAVSRAMAVRLVPADKIGEMFGLFNFMGYLSAIIGALFWGLILIFLYPLGQLGYRIALLSLAIFMLFGIIFLLRLPSESGGRSPLRGLRLGGHPVRLS